LFRIASLRFRVAIRLIGETISVFSRFSETGCCQQSSSNFGFKSRNVHRIVPSYFPRIPRSLETERMVTSRLLGLSKVAVMSTWYQRWRHVLVRLITTATLNWAAAVLLILNSRSCFASPSSRVSVVRVCAINCFDFL